MPSLGRLGTPKAWPLGHWGAACRAHGCRTQRETGAPVEGARVDDGSLSRNGGVLVGLGGRHAGSSRGVSTTLLREVDAATRRSKLVRELLSALEALREEHLLLSPPISSAPRPMLIETASLHNKLGDLGPPKTNFAGRCADVAHKFLWVVIVEHMLEHRRSAHAEASSPEGRVFERRASVFRRRRRTQWAPSLSIV